MGRVYLPVSKRLLKECPTAQKFAEVYVVPHSDGITIEVSKTPPETVYVYINRRLIGMVQYLSQNGGIYVDITDYESETLLTGYFPPVVDDGVNQKNGSKKRPPREEEHKF